MKRTLLFLSGLSACLFLVAASAASPAKVSDYPMKAQAIGDGVYAVITPARELPDAGNKGWNSNSAFVVTDDGVLVFDTGSSETIGRALKQAIAKVTNKPIRWIVNSHSHGDHWLGNAALAGPKTEIIATGAVKTRIAKEGHEWVERFKGMTEGRTGESTIRPPTTSIDERATRQFGGLAVEFIPSGDSHSPGDVVVWLPKQKILLGGDVLYSDRMPATFDAKIQQWITFLGEMESLNPKVVVPGHGGLADVQAIKRQRQFLADLWNTVKIGYEDGKQDFEILPAVRKRLAHYKKDLTGFDESIGASVSHAYLQVEAALF